MDKPKLPSSSGEIKDFCEQIVTVLRAVKLNEAGQEIRNLNEAPLLDKFVEHIWVRVFPGQDSLLWFCSDLQTGIIVNPLDMIIQSVKSKRMKALNYDWRGAQERWLLIYAAGQGLVDMAAHLEGPDIEDSSPFTQIFVWDKFTETIYCLAPKLVPLFENGNTLYLKYIPPNVIPYMRA